MSVYKPFTTSDVVVTPFKVNKSFTFTGASEFTSSNAGIDRFFGKNEPVDPRAGHIPGAVNAPFGDNTSDDGKFLSPAELYSRFTEVGISDQNSAVVYCGSGVSACNNLLAIEYAGLGKARLYAGSWSQWSHDKQRPIATK